MTNPHRVIFAGAADRRRGARYRAADSDGARQSATGRIGAMGGGDRVSRPDPDLRGGVSLVCRRLHGSLVRSFRNLSRGPVGWAKAATELRSLMARFPPCPRAVPKEVRARPRGHGGMRVVPMPQNLGRLCPPYIDRLHGITALSVPPSSRGAPPHDELLIGSGEVYRTLMADSGEQPVMLPFQDKVGGGWHVVIRYHEGHERRIEGFATEEEALNWIIANSKQVDE